MTAIAPWRVVEWTDPEGRVVKQLACHDDEIEQVLNLPFPAGAVCREPVMELTNFAKSYSWFRRMWCPYEVLDTFTETINQGDRDCRVVAVDEESGDYLYDYAMPAGRVFYRNRAGRPINAKNPPARWREYFRNPLEFIP